jgi:hypothetical protein
MISKKKNPQGDQKENKSERALQIIIGHVLAEFHANKRWT